MFGLTFEKLLLIGVIAVFVLGPERLPGYAAKLAQLVRTVRNMANGAKDRMRDEMGPDFDDVDWKKLDPRQYDPRRIIREALVDDEPTTPAVRPISKPATRPEPAYLQHKAKSAGGPVPVDGAAAGAGVAATGAGIAATGAGIAGAGVAAGAGAVASDGAVGTEGQAAAAGAVEGRNGPDAATGGSPVTVPSVAAYDSEAT